MGKLISVFVILLGLGGGLAAGFVLRPTPEGDGSEAQAAVAERLPQGAELGLFQFSNQFMVPLVVEGRIASVIVINLALEIAEHRRDTVSANAPRLRDALLQAMFDHANSGGFYGVFTQNETLAQLRRSLLEEAQKTLGADVVVGVLITDLLRTGS